MTRLRRVGPRRPGRGPRHRQVEASCESNLRSGQRGRADQVRPGGGRVVPRSGRVRCKLRRLPATGLLRIVGFPEKPDQVGHAGAVGQAVIARAGGRCHVDGTVGALSIAPKQIGQLHLSSWWPMASGSPATTDLAHCPALPTHIRRAGCARRSPFPPFSRNFSQNFLAVVLRPRTKFRLRTKAAAGSPRESVRSHLSHAGRLSWNG